MSARCLLPAHGKFFETSTTSVLMPQGLRRWKRRSLPRWSSLSSTLRGERLDRLFTDLSRGLIAPFRWVRRTDVTSAWGVLPVLNDQPDLVKNTQSHDCHLLQNLPRLAQMRGQEPCFLDAPALPI